MRKVVKILCLLAALPFIILFTIFFDSRGDFILLIKDTLKGK